MALGNLLHKNVVVNGLSLEISELSGNHISAMIRFLTDNRSHFEGPFPVTVENVLKSNTSARNWLNDKLAGRSDSKNQFCVVRNAKREVIFAMMALNFDWRVPRCEIAWMLDKNHSGQGIARVCCTELMKYLVQECGVNKIIARVDPLNQRSMNLALKLGFVQEGVHKSDFRDGFGKLIDVCYMAYFAPTLSAI